MTVKFTNNANSTLASGINSSATSMTVASASSFPSLAGANDYCYLTLQESGGTTREIVKATALSSNTFTVIRGQDNTSAATWSSGILVELRITSALLQDVIDGLGSGSMMDTDIFTGDGSDTTFTLSRQPDNENNLLIFIDGVFQAHNAYSVSGTTLTFSVAPADTRVITAYHMATTVGGSNLVKATMTGDNSDTTLDVGSQILHENNVQVFFDGVYQSKGNFTVSGSVITFSTAPPTGVAVEAILNTATNISTAAQVSDADNDTLIQVEESADEDTIRMDVAGTEVLTLTNSAMTLKGTTPTLTIGDAGAEDTKIVFDGNAQDYYIGLDDSADDLIIGKGSTVGTTPAISIDENLKSTLVGQVVIDPADGVADDAYALFVRNNEATDGRNYGLVVRAGSTSADESFSVRDHANASTYFKVRGDGNIGIGTSAPLTPLQIAGDASNAFLISPVYQSIGNNLFYNGSAWDAFNHSAAGGVFQIGAGTFALRRGTAADPPVVSYTIYADADGKVGINNTTNTAYLDVRAPSGVSGPKVAFFKSDNHGLGVAIDVGATFTNLQTNNTSYPLTLNADGGNVLVGTTDSYDKFTVGRASTSQTGGMTLVNTQNGGYGSGITWESKRSDANNVQTAGRIYVAGASSWNSDSTASSQFILFLRSANTLTERLRISHDGTFTGSASNNISDQRLKENINTITSPLEKIKALTGRTFTWKEKAKQPSGTKYGFIAQEVESVVSDLVNDQVGLLKIKEDESVIYEDLDASEEGEWSKSVQTTGIIPILVEAMKEQQALIETLQTKVAALEEA